MPGYLSEISLNISDMEIIPQRRCDLCAVKHRFQKVALQLKRCPQITVT